MSRRLSWAALAGALALALSGCGLGGGLYDMTLPGGADVGDDPITITADFTDVVDLVPQSSVKVDNIAVGRVLKIRLNPDGSSARVSMLVRKDLGLPGNTAARLQQTSLLGEKYVALVRPTGPAGSTDTTGTTDLTGSASELRDGSHIGLAATSQVAEVEQVLGAVSTVLNGGGIGKFQEISRELQKITDHPEEVRGFLRSTRAFVAGLDSRKQAITAALDSLRDLSETLDGDKDKIATALDGLSPGMQVLVEQRKELVAMLESLDRLSDVTMRTLNASQKDMIEDFKLLEPILRNLAAAGDALPQSLQMLLTYPFPDAVLGAIKGDYINGFVTTNYSSLPPGCAAMGCPWQQPGFAVSGSARTVTGKTALPRSSTASTPASRSPSPSASGTPSTQSSPSPVLLPPTDSPLPGIVQPTVQVPTASPSSADTAPGQTPAPTATED